eukprot:1157884-Pelagomonas_calceolata.AAC.10
MPVLGCAQVELEQLLGHMRSVVPDKLLLQLLSDWLKPDSYSSGHSCGGAGAGGPALPAPQFLQPLQQAASTTTTSGSACTFARTGSAGGSGSVSAAPPPPAEVGIEECCGQPGLCLGVQLVKRTPGNARTLAEVRNRAEHAHAIAAEVSSRDCRERLTRCW